MIQKPKLLKLLHYKEKDVLFQVGIFLTNNFSKVEIKMKKIEELKKDLKRQLSPFRYEHCLLVAAEAKELAKHYQLDEEKAYIAGLLHDVAREFDPQEKDKWQHLGKVPLKFMNSSYSEVAHAEIGAVLTKEIYGFDEEICDAIRYHAIGHVLMTPLAKIVFIADKVARKNRNETLTKAARVAYQDIDQALRMLILYQQEILQYQGKYLLNETKELLHKLNTQEGGKIKMKKERPRRLKKGDKIAIVSLSWGGLGDEALIHKYEIAKKRLEEEFGLEVQPMPHALKGTSFVYQHPELRAQDLMEAFQDKSVAAIFCAIGGDDSIRILPYIDYTIIRENPKIFMGYSDSTVSHFIMHKAGLVSFYGPAIMCDFGEYVKMFDYTKQAVFDILFHDTMNYEVKSSPVWSRDFVNWSEENRNIEKKLLEEKHGYEVLQGSGIIQGEILGGCIDVFSMIIGTEIWPTLEDWQDKILLLETSDEKMEPSLLLHYLRNLGAQGTFKVIKGILVGKPQEEKYYEEYKEVYHKVLEEFASSSLPVLYNVNIGHALPIGILPLGSIVEVDYNAKKIRFVESATIEDKK